MLKKGPEKSLSSWAHILQRFAPVMDIFRRPHVLFHRVDPLHLKRALIVPSFLLTEVTFRRTGTLLYGKLSRWWFSGHQLRFQELYKQLNHVTPSMKPVVSKFTWLASRTRVTRCYRRDHALGNPSPSPPPLPPPLPPPPPPGQGFSDSKAIRDPTLHTIQTN